MAHDDRTTLISRRTPESAAMAAEVQRAMAGAVVTRDVPPDTLVGGQSGTGDPVDCENAIRR